MVKSLVTICASACAAGDLLENGLAHLVTPLHEKRLFEELYKSRKRFWFLWHTGRRIGALKRLEIDTRASIRSLCYERRSLFYKDGVWQKTASVYTLETGSLVHRIDDYDRDVAEQQRLQKDAVSDLEEIARYRRLASYAVALCVELASDLARELSPKECGAPEKPTFRRK